MENKILTRILQKYNPGNLLDFLSTQISGSDLNSLLIEVFKIRSQNSNPSELLKAYSKNRFVQKANIPPILFAQMELKILIFLKNKDYDIIEFGPIAPLGTCSVFGTLSQNLILSATRGTEVVADITNLMALESAKRKKTNPIFQKISLAATHRLTRCQPLLTDNHTAHFKILCLSTAGQDKGNSTFEVEAFTTHINTHLEIFTQILQIPLSQLKVKIFQLENNNLKKLSSISSRVIPSCLTKNVEIINIPQHQKIYYKELQFQINYLKDDQEYFIVDGGFVDWTQQLLQNKKERLMTSGMGIEYLFKILNNSD